MQYSGADYRSPPNKFQCARPMMVDLNTPSISGFIAGAVTVKRTLTAVLASGPDRHRVRFEASFKPANGSCIDIDVWPRGFEVSHGESVETWITVSTADCVTHDVTQFGQVRSCPLFFRVLLFSFKMCHP